VPPVEPPLRHELERAVFKFKTM